MLQVVTNSQLRAYRRCPRLHLHSYVDGYRPIETPYVMRFGTLVHLGLEGWWGSGLSFGLEKMRSGDYSDEWMLIKAEELLRGYDARWRDEGWETIAVEKEFRVPLMDGTDIAGKIDAIARRNGQVFLVEHKTSGVDITPGSRYWQKLTLDSQVSTYLQATAEYEPVGILYDVLYRPSMENLQATPPEKRKYTKSGSLYAYQRSDDETPDDYRVRLREDIASNPDKYYARGTVVRTENEAAEALSDTREWAKRALADKMAPKNPENCDGCGYFPVCSGVARLEDPLRYRKAERANEELST
jgi:hypothetical protein